MKSVLKTLNTARQNSSRAAVSVNTARPINTAYLIPTMNCARPASNVFNRAHSHVIMPFNKFTTNKNSNLNEKVNTIRRNVTTVEPKAVLELQQKGVINSGCSRHMTGNKSYLSNYEEIDGGFVAFEDTECVVLSPDFKLLDENQVLLRVPRKNNMYSVDLKNVAPSGGLTCLFANATLDESNLWHRRLGHINFKTMKKLVKRNLDETSGILKAFITRIENQINHRVKIIKCDNETEFKNKEMNQFCEMKGIKREFSVARTPQQNRVAERKNKRLIEAARTMLADSKLPTTFWAEAVDTACYVQNRVLVFMPHNKTPYELFLGRKPILSFMRPFGCPVTILNTLDYLGKFDGKADEGFFVGYSLNSKAFRWTRMAFDIDTLTKSINYEPVVAGNQSNDPPFSSSLKDSPDARFKPSGEEEKKDDEHLENKDSEVPNTKEPRVNQEQDKSVNNTNNIYIVSSTVNTASIEVNDVDENTVYGCADDPNMSDLENIV
ncbi:ribonuclease H-like domain-containing protein [Tanacetum coccineum]